MHSLVYVVLVIAIRHASKACTPGETRQDGHNTCLCSSDGLDWTCAPAPRTCVPETEFKHYCNECYCLEDGLVDNAFCTKLICDRNKWNENGTRKYPQADSNRQLIHPIPRYLSMAQKQYCEPGTIFRKYCNYCVCGTRYTIPSCTNMVCDLTVWNENGTINSDVALLNTETPTNDPEKGSCNNGEIFANYCNYCFCGIDGTIAGALCTNAVCDLAVWNKNGTMKSDVTLLRNENTNTTRNNEPEEERCGIGQIFRNFCNYCFCGIRGTITRALCTNMVCDLAVWNKNGTRKSNVTLLRNERSVESPKSDIS